MSSCYQSYPVTYFGLSFWVSDIYNWETVVTIHLLRIFGEDYTGKIWGAFQGILFIFLHFASVDYVSEESILFGGLTNLKIFIHLLQRFIQGALWDKINLKKITAKMKLVPTLLNYIHISRAHCWNRCDWFGNHSAIILFLYCLVS